jgi:hypothetical protein
LLRAPFQPQAMSTLLVSPSPASYSPYWAVIEAPSKSLRVMMLTTPAIASEPYSAEAPSSSTSIRSTIASGMVLRSVAAPTPEAEASLTQRTPSTSTSTRLAPRCRRSTWAEPAPTPLPSGGKPKLPDELNLVLSAEPEAVSAWTTSPIEVRPVRSMSSRVTVCTGTWPSTSAFLIREPVTCTRSRVVARVSVSVASWAATMPGTASSSDSCTAMDSRVRGMADIVSLPRKSMFRASVDASRLLVPDRAAPCHRRVAYL